MLFKIIILTAILSTQHAAAADWPKDPDAFMRALPEEQYPRQVVFELVEHAFAQGRNSEEGARERWARIAIILNDGGTYLTEHNLNPSPEDNLAFWTKFWQWIDGRVEPARITEYVNLIKKGPTNGTRCLGGYGAVDGRSVGRRRGRSSTGFTQTEFEYVR